MKNLILSLGRLTALRRYNRDRLAETVGMTRSNLVSALHGRRSLPPVVLPRLRGMLGLDEDYKFTLGHSHVLHARSGERDAPLVADVMHSFLSGALQEVWLIRGMGDRGCEAVAYVFCDQCGTVLVVRNDDARLLSFMPQGLCPQPLQERELGMHDFDALMTALPVKDVLTLLHNKGEIWTWAKVRSFAEKHGITPKDAADALENTLKTAS